MKKLFFLTLIGILVIFTSSCSVKTNSGSTGNISVENISMKDSTKSYICSIELDYPTKGNKILIHRIQEWISESFDGTFAGNFSDKDAFIKYYFNKNVEDLKELSKDYGTLSDMTLETRISIKKIYETPKYVTYELYMSSYSGGAHGTYETHGASFRKSDGRLFNWDILNNSINSEDNKDVANINDLISDALKQEFKIRTSEEFEEILFNNYLELPDNPPYFTKDGVVVAYSLYEIVAYAYGQPIVTIPYSKIKPLLTTSAKEVLE